MNDVKGVNEYAELDMRLNSRNADDERSKMYYVNHEEEVVRVERINKAG